MVEGVLEMGMQKSLKNYRASQNSQFFGFFLIREETDGVNYGLLSPVTLLSAWTMKMFLQTFL